MKHGGIARGTHGKSHPHDKMLPKERAHWQILWGREGDISSTIRGVFKKRHRKKSRAHGKRIIEEQQS